METKTVHLQFTFFTEFTSFLWSCVFLGSCKCFGTLFGQFLLVHSFHCIHRLALFFYCCWCWCCSSSSSVVFILLFIFLRLSRIDSNKTVQSWSINTCKIPQKYKSTNKLKRSEIRQSKINSRWVAGPIGQTNRWPSVWCSKYYFL